jgi:hypothetical protein
MRSPKNKENKNSSSNTNKDKKKFIIYGSLDLTNIKLPSKIKENISSEDVVKSVAEFYKVFKSLDYIKKDINELETKLEWNSWEISQFLYLLQLNRNILMPDCEKILHESILKFTKEQVINEMKYIILKYNKLASKDELFFLKNQLIWSAKEVSFIFYYLSLIKEMSDKNLDI